MTVGQRKRQDDAENGSSHERRFVCSDCVAKSLPSNHRRTALRSDRGSAIGKALGRYDSVRSRLPHPPVIPAHEAHQPALAGPHAGREYAARNNWAEGMFVVPLSCRKTRPCGGCDSRNTRRCLADSSTFATWTIESFVSALETEDAGVWVDELKNRYLTSESRRGLSPPTTEG